MTEFTVIAPEGCEDYLTPSKKYSVVEERKSGFDIIDDAGMRLNCLYRGCNQLNGQDWKVSIPAVMEKVK